MKKTFRLIKPSGDVGITYCKGNTHSERRDGKVRMTFTLESPDNIFKFVLLNPSEDDQKLMAKDVIGLAVKVEGLTVEYVLFRNGRKISSPDFVLCKTEELPADERTARHSAETAKTSAIIAKTSAETAKALEQLAEDFWTENTKLKKRIKKVEAAICATMNARRKTAQKKPRQD